MDVTITGIGAVVVAQLRPAGYMESTVGQYEKTIRALTGYARGQGVGVSLTTSPRTGRFSVQRSFDYRRLVAVFDSYMATGRVDLSVRKRGGGGPQPTGDQFVALDASWEADMADRGLAAATREAYGRVARGYLCFLESSGTFDLDAATAGPCLRFWHRCRRGGRSRVEAIEKISAWLDAFYNLKRRHSANNGMSPIDFEEYMAEARKPSIT